MRVTEKPVGAQPSAALTVALLMTGGLQNLQTVFLTSAPPFAIIMVCSGISLWKSLGETERKL